MKREGSKRRKMRGRETGGRVKMYMRRSIGRSAHFRHAMFLIISLWKAALEKGTHPSLLPASVSRCTVLLRAR
jgi:hypothetical protein